MLEHGFDVIYSIGSLSDLRAWLAHDVPVILFVRTNELPYWNIDTPHAIMLIGIEGEQAYLLDPAMDDAPVEVSIGDLMLAWSYFDYMYATLRLSI